MATFAHEYLLADELLITSPVGAKLRASPQGKRIGALGKGTRTTILERRGSWAKVSVNGQRGWVYIPRAARVISGDSQADDTQGGIDTQAGQGESSVTTGQASTTGTALGATPGAMRYDTVAASGACMLNDIQTDQQAKALINYYNISTPGSTAEERINLARALYQVSALYGGKFTPFTNFTFKFSSRKGFSRYNSSTDTIDLNRCNKRGKNCGASSNINVARLVHEMGHRFGHAATSGHDNYYEYFKDHVRGCYMTGYSDNNSKENVGEILSAFITRPERLSSGSKACKKAYEYLSTSVFKKNGSLASCDSSRIGQLRSRINGVNGSELMFAETFEGVFGTNDRIQTATLEGPGAEALR